MCQETLDQADRKSMIAGACVALYYLVLLGILFYGSFLKCATIDCR